MNAYKIIIKALDDVTGSDVTFSLVETEDSAHGDYATNAAFPLSKKRSIVPKECAESLIPKLQEQLASCVEKIEVAGPGFINFFLRDKVIRHENEKGDVQIVTKYTGKNVLVEHSSLNLFKPFTIGHLVNNIIGEFVTRATKVGGGNVGTMSFPSDVSLGIAKAIYIIREDGGINSLILKHENLSTYLGESYARGVALYNEKPEIQEEVKKISNDMYEWKTTPEFEIYEYAKKENVNYFFSVLEALGSHFDEVVYESQAGHVGAKIVNIHTGEGKVFTRSDGAIVYIPDESRKDLNTAVFINSEGHPTYEAKDIGLLDCKFITRDDGFMPDLSYFITDAEQIPHFKVVLDAASKLGDEWKERVEKSHHVPHGRMLFKGAKMSSRLGGVPLALDVISSVEEEVKERAGEKIAHLGNEEKEGLTREIALSALRIAVLRSKLGININFDPETSLSFEGDSGPYLLYTHARCSSLLEKGNVSTPKWSDIPVTALERKLIHFENELTHVCNELAPQKLTTYLFSVAQLFNSYYASTQIIVEGDEAGNAHRLMIVMRVKMVLKKGLYVLGIEAPNTM